MNHLTVPANLLLMGEYAVLEPGGLGIICAVDIKAGISITPSLKFCIKGYTGGDEIYWDMSGRHRNILFSSIINSIKTYFNKVDLKYELPHICITVDTRNFFSPRGRKRGFGSSAAVAAGITYALLTLKDKTILPHDIFTCAVSAHRAAQGGKGSGYDIAASLFGGISLFTGGGTPLCRPCKIDWIPDIYLFNGPEKVKTVSAVNSYMKWKQDNPEKAGYFLTESNRIITEFEKARDWEKGEIIFKQYSRLSVWLGKEINVPAEITDSFLPGIVRENSLIYKALGAGNELGAFFSSDYPETIDPYVLKITISQQGTIWT